PAIPASGAAAAIGGQSNLAYRLSLRGQTLTIRTFFLSGRALRLFPPGPAPRDRWPRNARPGPMLPYRHHAPWPPRKSPYARHGHGDAADGAPGRCAGSARTADKEW